jgi:hypothetical protein
MHPLQGKRHGWALLYDRIAVDHLHGETMLAAIDIHQLQDRYVAGLAIRLIVQPQSEQMRSLQAGLDEYVDGEGAVVGAQGFGDGQASEFQYLIRDVRLFAVAGFGWRFRFLGG